MSITVNVPQGYSLAVSTDNATGTYQQVSDTVAHSPTFMGVNSTVVLGPYAGPINFELNAKSGNMCYCLCSSAVNLTTMLNALVASAQSPAPAPVVADVNLQQDNPQ